MKKPKSVFEGWAKACSEFNTEIWPFCKARERPETGLYMTKRSYWSGNTKFYYTPMYQVWIEGEREIVTPNMNEAIAYWKHRAEEEGIEYTDDAEEMRRMR